ncbi:MAG: calcium-binding protein [Pseudomonadota bacterium]
MATFSLAGVRLRFDDDGNLVNGGAPVTLGIIVADGTNTITYSEEPFFFPEVLDIIFDEDSFQAINVDGVSQNDPNINLDAALIEISWGAGNQTLVMDITDASTGDDLLFFLAGDPLPPINNIGDALSFFRQVTDLSRDVRQGFQIGDVVDLSTLPGVVVSDNDHFTGTVTDDSIYTALGDDTIEGGAGNDSIIIDGRDGSGTVLASDSTGKDNLIRLDFDGRDAGEFINTGSTLVLTSFQGHTTTVILNGDGSSPFEFVGWYNTGEGSSPQYTSIMQLALSVADVTQDNAVILGTSAGDTIVAPNLGITIDSPTGPEWSEIYGGQGNDNITGSNQLITYLYGGEGNDTITSGGFGTQGLYGGMGNDSLVGTNGDEEFYGDADNDTVDGGRGDDTIEGGAGNDDVRAGTGDDSVDGGTGEDFIRGGVGEDTLNGGDDNDRIVGQRNADSIDGGAGEDNLKGGGGNDSIDGGAGNDFIKGGTRADVLNGGEGDDRIFANSFADVLNGDAGNDLLNAGGDADTLNGGTGNDTLKGGGGQDVFVFEADMGADVVLDFQDDVDALQISSALTGGDTDAARVVATFADVIAGNTVFDFGGGNTITLNGVMIDTALVNDMTFI